jgi:hypothetical protein
MAKIPGLNYNIRQALDRLQYQADVYNEEFVERFLLVMGHPDAGFETEYGIVAPLDPAAAVVGDSLAFSMQQNAENAEAFDVNPGIAVTQSAMWVKLENHVRALTLADTSIGVQNVVYLRYLLEPADDEINEFNDPVVPYTRRIGDPRSLSDESVQVEVDTLEVFVNYTDDVRADFVPLAIVTNQTTEDPITSVVTTQLAFDFTRDSYIWNRPWFSVADVEHRAQIGSGVQSNTNPHAISQNDLTVGDFSPSQLQLDHGVIIADDRSVEKIPGVRCLVAIPYSAILTDDGSGTKTTIANAKYAELVNYPIRLGRVWVESSDTDWAAEIVKGTNIVVFPYEPPVDETINLYYTKVQACEPPVGANEVAFATSNPDSEELILAGGSYYQSLSNTTENFADAQRVPMVYEMLVDGEGNLIKTPQVIYCYKRLEAISTSDVFSIDLYGPGKIIMGLAGASGSPTMSVKIRLYGKDADGNNHDYLFEFDSTWQDPGPIPRTDIQEEAFKVSDVVFSAVEQIVIEEMTDYGVNASIMIWSALNPYDTYDKLKDACHVAEVMWDGLRLAEIRDKRIVNTTTREFLNHQPSDAALPYMVNALAGGNQNVYMESFLRPRYHNQIPNASRGQGLTDVLPVNNISKLRIGASGNYRTRALPVANTAKLEWRVVLLPLAQVQDDFYYPYLQAPVFYYFKDSTQTWDAVTMTPQAGMFNTFKAALTEAPKMVRVELQAADYEGMLIFG